jgi:hypothetical protein
VREPFNYLVQRLTDSISARLKLVMELPGLF